MSGRGEYLCYTDGSCKAGDEAPGGWGFFIKSPGEMREMAIEGHGKAIRTLAKTMEYRAVAEALEALPNDVRAVVFSDNQSLIENVNRHLPSWRETGFAKVDPSIVESVRRIDRAMAEKRLSVRFQWIRAHNGNAGLPAVDGCTPQGGGLRGALSSQPGTTHRWHNAGPPWPAAET